MTRSGHGTGTERSGMWQRDIDDEAPFERLETSGELDAWLAKGGASLLLLHDPYCPISASAYREMARLPGPIGLIDVAAATDLSRTVEARTGIRHESPQAILLRDGDPVWSASHYRISADAVAEAMGKPEAERTET